MKKKAQAHELTEYSIPVDWRMYGYVKVKARNLKEAVEKALSPEESLPEGDYLDDSEVVAWEVVGDMNIEGDEWSKLTEEDEKYLAEMIKKEQDNEKKV